LVIILESLSEVILDVKSPGQLVTALRSHGFIFCVVKGVQGQVLDLGVVLFEEEMVGQVIEDHGVRGVNGVGLRKFSDTLL
jgi:hypothetical protein